MRLLVAGVHWPPETFLRRLFDGLADRGVSVTIACSARPDRAWLEGVNRSWLPTVGGSGSALGRLARVGRSAVRALLVDPSACWTLAARSRNYGEAAASWRTLAGWTPFVSRKYDVVYFPWNTGAIELLPAVGSTPVVVSCRGAQINVAPHNPERQAIREGLRETFSVARLVHCVCDDIRREAIELGLEPEKARVIRGGVDCSMFHPLECRAESCSALSIVAVGSLIWRKGLEYALIAVRHLVERDVPVHLDLVGDGSDRQRIVYTIQDLDLGGRVTLWGTQPPDVVRERLQRSDVFVLSSLGEGIANVALEAMACGLPVVTTDAGGMREAVDDGIEGFVVPVRDPCAIADRLERLWRDPALRAAMGRAARSRVKRDYELGRHIDEFLELFEEAVRR